LWYTQPTDGSLTLHDLEKIIEFHEVRVLLEAVDLPHHLADELHLRGGVFLDLVRGQHLAGHEPSLLCPNARLLRVGEVEHHFLIQDNAVDQTVRSAEDNEEPPVVADRSILLAEGHLVHSSRDELPDELPLHGLRRSDGSRLRLCVVVLGRKRRRKLVGRVEDASHPDHADDEGDDDSDDDDSAHDCWYLSVNTVYLRNASDVEVVVGSGFPPIQKLGRELLLRAGEEDLGAIIDDPVLTVEMPRIAELCKARRRAHDESTHLNLTLEPLLVRLREPQLLPHIAVDLRSRGVDLGRVLPLLLERLLHASEAVEFSRRLHEKLAITLLLLLQLGDPLPQGADGRRVGEGDDGDERGDEDRDAHDCDVHCQLSCATEWQRVAPGPRH